MSSENISMKNLDTGEVATIKEENGKFVAYMDDSNVPWILQFDTEEDLIADLERIGFRL